MKNISILIVEDEGIVAEDIASIVRKIGYGVAGIAATGEKAIELADQMRPSLVLMDIRLGGAMDGIEAAQQIHRRCNIPILFLTANSDLGTDERARQAGTVGIIMKPFNGSDIGVQIEKALNKATTE